VRILDSDLASNLSVDRSRSRRGGRRCLGREVDVLIMSLWVVLSYWCEEY